MAENDAIQFSLPGRHLPSSAIVDNERVIYSSEGEWVIEREFVIRYDLSKEEDDNKNANLVNAVTYCVMSPDTLKDWLELNGYGKDANALLIEKTNEMLEEFEKTSQIKARMRLLNRE